MSNFRSNLIGLVSKYGFIEKNLRKIYLCYSEIKYIFLHVKEIIRAKTIIKGVCNDNNKVYLILDHTIGDNALTFPYIEEWKKQNHIKHLVFVGPCHKLQISKFYPNIANEKIDISKEEHNILRIFAVSLVGYKYIKKSKNIFMICPYTIKLHEKLKNKQLLDIIVIYMLHLDIKTTPELPIIFDNKIRKLGRNIISDKTVIINTICFTMRQPKLLFFETLSTILIKRGFKVFTNTVKHEDYVLPGTIPLCCNLIDAVCVAEQVGFIIGAQSGFMDLMLYANCTSIVIYADGTDVTDVLKKPKLRAKEVPIVLTDNMKSDINKVVNIIEKNDSGL